MKTLLLFDAWNRRADALGQHLIGESAAQSNPSTPARLRTQLRERNAFLLQKKPALTKKKPRLVSPAREILKREAKKLHFQFVSSSMDLLLFVDNRYKNDNSG